MNVILNLEVAREGNRRPPRGPYQDATRTAGFKITRCAVVPKPSHPGQWVFVAEASCDGIGLNGYARALAARLVAKGIGMRVAMQPEGGRPHWFHANPAHLRDKTPARGFAVLPYTPEPVATIDPKNPDDRARLRKLHAHLLPTDPANLTVGELRGLLACIERAV